MAKKAKHLELSPRETEPSNVSHTRRLPGVAMRPIRPPTDFPDHLEEPAPRYRTRRAAVGPWSVAPMDWPGRAGWLWWCPAVHCS